DCSGASGSARTTSAARPTLCRYRAVDRGLLSPCSPCTGADGDGRAAEAGTARGDVAVTRAARFRAHPEGVQFSLRQVKAELHRPPRQPRQVPRPLPGHLLQGAVATHGPTRLLREGFERVPLLVEHLGTQLAIRRVQVDEEILAAKAHRPCGQRALAVAGVQRGEAVAA